MNEQRTLIDMDELAGDHDWQTTQLRKLVAHIAEYVINELPSDIPEIDTLIALTHIAEEFAGKISDQAEKLNPSHTVPGYSLVAVPNEHMESLLGAGYFHRCLFDITCPNATREDLTDALARFDYLVAMDDESEYLQDLVRVVEMRGYAVEWLTDEGDKEGDEKIKRKPQLTPAMSMQRGATDLEGDGGAWFVPPRVIRARQVAEQTAPA